MFFTSGLLLLSVFFSLGGELQEDIFQAQADGAEFGEIPAGVDHAAGQFGADVAALQAFDFEGNAAVPGVLHHDAADAGDLFEASLDFAGVGAAVGGFDFEADGFGAAQAVGEVGDRILRDQLALADDDDALAGLLHLAEDVGAEDDGVVAGEGLEQLADFDDLLGVEAAGGLVEDQDIGVVDDGLGDADALAVAFGQLADQLVADVAEGAAVDDLVGAALDIGAGDAFELADEGEVLDDLHFGVERRRFGQVADALLDLLRVLQDVEAGDVGRAGRWAGGSR